MKNPFHNIFQIKNSFISVLILIILLIVTLSTLLTRLSLSNIEQSEAAMRDSVSTYVTNTFSQATKDVQPAAQAIVADQSLMKMFADGNRTGLLDATRALFAELNATDNIKQMQFTSADFKVFLRSHNPPLFGDDVTTSRPTLVDCITQKHMVAGLEQGRSGYGFRAVVPSFYAGVFLGCTELGSDLDDQFLKPLNDNYPGKWAIVRLESSTSLTSDKPVIATLNEPEDAAIRAATYSTPENILSNLRKSRTFYEYIKPSQEMALYIPIKSFKGDVTLYVRYVCSTSYYKTILKMTINSFVISSFGLILTAFAFWFLYRGIRTPLHQLVMETEKIKKFDLKDDVHIRAPLIDIEKLVTAVSDMKMGLRSFQKYVPANLVRQLMETQQEARVGGKLKELTIFFSDIQDFTAITEHLPPNELTIQLSEYFNAVTNVIVTHSGTVDKYIGDAVMAFWGAPTDNPAHALHACRAALACRREIDVLSRKWAAAGKYEFKTRIGVSTGEVVVGNIGSDQRLNYSVIGDPVNLASRLEGLNKQYVTSIIISEETYQQCASEVEARLIDFVVVKGKVEPVRIYELIGERGDISPRQKNP